MKNRLVWAGLAAFVGFILWKWTRRAPADYVSIGWGGGATAGLPTLAPKSVDQRYGNVNPSVPPPPGPSWAGNAYGGQDNSNGNLGSGGW